MQHDPFDPQNWLARWSAVGGAWAGNYLIRPGGHDAIGADLLAAELDDGRRAMLAEYLSMKGTTE